MRWSRVVRRTFSILLVTMGAALAASSQTQQSPPRSMDEIKVQAAKLYASAHPYLDETPTKLKKMVRELAGLEPAPSPAANQDQLSALLAKVGAKADELLRKVPNLVSDEAVSESQWNDTQPAVPGCVGIVCSETVRGSQRDQEFNYIILNHPAHSQQSLLEEYRTSRHDKPVEGAGAPNFQGFALDLVIFSTPNQSESRYRLLGQQKIDGHSTFVIGFAQIPGAIEYPGKIVTGRGSVPMLLQGIAWVDQTDFRMVRLRTDILAPQPEIGFQRQTANILFGAVRIAALDSELWLPHAVHVVMEANGLYLQEQHQYSKYRLYEVKSKIILFPDN